MKLIPTLTYTFTTTLKILINNKNQLQLPRKHPFAISSLSSNPSVSSRNPQQLLPYYTINQEYLRSVHLKLANQFKELDVFKNKFEPNSALAYGEHIQDYPLQKVIQVCLRWIKEGRCQGELWSRVENRVRSLLRNASFVDHCILLYISSHHMPQSFQQFLLSQLTSQLPHLTQLERQLFFYTLNILPQPPSPSPSPSPPSPSPLNSKQNQLKSKLLSQIHKSKLNLASLIQWILLISIVNTSPIHIVTGFYQKLFIYDKYKMMPQQVLVVVRGLEDRAINGVGGTEEGKSEDMVGRVVGVFKQRNSNWQQLINSVSGEQQIIYKSYLPDLFTTKLTPNQLTSPTLPLHRSLYHLFQTWKNNTAQPYQLSSIYQSLQQKINKRLTQQNIHNSSNNANKKNFVNLDLLYYICWIQLGIQKFINWKNVVDIAHGLPYVPAGLEWPLWNYLGYVVRNGVVDQTEYKQKIEQIVNKIKNIGTTHKKYYPNMQPLKKSVDIAQLHKFFHQIKTFTFKTCQPIQNLDYIAHFINHDIKIIIHCLRTTDYIKSQYKCKHENNEHSDSGNKQSIQKMDNLNLKIGVQQQKYKQKQKQINNYHKLNKKMLKDHFGYIVIDVEVAEFVKLGYGERLEWIRDCIREARVSGHTREIGQ